MGIKFKDEQNIISILQSGLKKYESNFLGKQFMYLYYDNINNTYGYIEILFKKEHFKHLCGNSNKEAGIHKEIVSAKKFYELCKAKRLGHQHIILKKDNTSIQKLNILNNLNLLTNNNTLYCNINNVYKNLKCDCMIGLADGNITLALQRFNKYSFPLSSLDFNIRDSGEVLFEVVLVASKAIGAEIYSLINMNKIDIKYLPDKYKKMFY